MSDARELCRECPDMLTMYSATGPEAHDATGPVYTTRRLAVPMVAETSDFHSITHEPLPSIWACGECYVEQRWINLPNGRADQW